MDIQLKESDIRRNTEIEATQLYSDMLEHVAPAYHILAKRRVNGNNFAWEIPTEAGVSWHKLGEANDIEKDVVCDIISSCKNEFKKISSQLSENIIDSVFATPNDNEYIFYSIKNGSNNIRVIITAWGYSFPAKTRGKSISLSEQMKSAPQHVIVAFTIDGKPGNNLSFNIKTPNGLIKHFKTDELGQTDLLNNKVGSIIRIEVPMYNAIFDLEVIKGTKEYIFDIKPIITEREPEPEFNIMQQVEVKLLQNGEPLKLYEFNVEYENGKHNKFLTNSEGKTDISTHKVGTKLRIWVNDKSYDLVVKEGVLEYVFNIESTAEISPKIQEVEVVILQNNTPISNIPIVVTCNDKMSENHITDNDGRSKLSSQKVGTKIRINVLDYNEIFNFEVLDGIREYKLELKPKALIKRQNIIALFLQKGKVVDKLNVIVRKPDGTLTTHTTNEKGQILLPSQEVGTSLLLEIPQFNTTFDLVVEDGVEEYIFNIEQPQSLHEKSKSRWRLNLLEILVLIISTILFYLAWPHVWNIANEIVNTII